MECQTLTEQLAHWAQECPERVWLRDLSEAGETTYSWSEAQEQVLYLYYLPLSLLHFLLVPLRPSSL